MDFLVRQCRSTSAYPINPSVQTEYILTQIYNEIVQRYPNPEVNTRNYLDQNGSQFRVVYIRFQTLVPYKNNTYNVFSQVVFPPNFPAVPPIFSVINSDENRFQVNKNYFNFLLPDATYEVKLLSAGPWTPNVSSFAAMFTEFCATLSQHFPFFATSNPLKNPNMVFAYNSRYNDPAVPKPFDYPGQGGSSNFGLNNQPPPGLFMGGGYSQPISPPANNFFNTPQPFTPSGPYNPPPYAPPGYMNPQNVPNSQYIPNTSGYGSQNTSFQPSDRPAPTTQAFKDALYKVKAELDSDSKILFENADYLLKKKSELGDLDSRLRGAKDTVGDQIRRAKQQEEELKVQVEKSKAGKKDKIENYLEFGSPKDEAILKIMADLRGNQETEIFIENTFMESSGADLDAFLLKMNALWRKQFDRSLALRVI